MIKLHHLNHSRSKRIIWLLEELGVSYEIVPHLRDKETFLAPPSLKAIHPLGKSPVIELEDGQMIAESGAITECLINLYGLNKLAPKEKTPQWNEYIQWLHFAEGSAVFPLLLVYFLKRHESPLEALNAYAQTELHKILGYLDATVAQRPYLMGDMFTGADILNSFVIEMAAEVQGLEKYSHLQEYLNRLQERPAKKRADEIELKYNS